MRADLARDDILTILARSADRRGPVAAEWTSSGPEYVALRFDWSIEETGEHIAEGSGVPVAQWRALAEAFIAGLHDDEVRRGG